MRLRRVVPLVLLIALLATAAADAATRIGIVRPGNEAALSDSELGEQLYAGNCSTCHGIQGEGRIAAGPRRGAGDIQGQGPPLTDAGAQAAHFYLSRGLMPLATPGAQPWHDESPFTERELDALVGYVASLGSGPPIPDPKPEEGDVADGLHLFTSNCAGCHQVVAEGGMLSGARVPQLKGLTPEQIAEAIRIGPYVMPEFSEKRLTDDEVNSIIAYIKSSESPEDRGGWGIDHIGPIPEGMVTWFIAAVALIGLCVIIGQRMRES